jgi:translation initiation factor IF-3
LCVKIKGGTNIAKQKGLLINDDISFPRVRLIDDKGEMVGVVPLSVAKERALDANMDLVLISPNPDNPVTRIMDYGRYAFEMAKKEREARKNQKTTTVKEVQLKLTTDDHDLQVKTRNAIRFLEEGDRVKVVIRFRGREMAYASRGIEVMKSFAEGCGDIAEIDRIPRVEGRNMIMYLSPKKDKK